MYVKILINRVFSFSFHLLQKKNTNLDENLPLHSVNAFLKKGGGLLVEVSTFWC